MGDKTAFKDFVRANPNLIKYVKDGKKSWQDFFELFSLYGSSDSVWNEYLNPGVSSRSFDITSWLKGIDLDSIQDSISSIQRVLGVVQDLANNDSSVNEEYKPRPIYKHFED